MQNYDKNKISAANKVKTDVIYTGLDKYTNPTHCGVRERYDVGFIHLQGHIWGLWSQFESDFDEISLKN